MGRPIKVMREELVREAFDRRTLGVPIRKILLDLKIDLSIHGLNNLLSHYDYAVRHQDKEVYNALFPDFIEDPNHTKRKGNVVIQEPTTHSFEGYYPFGIWIDKRK